MPRDTVGKSALERFLTLFTDVRAGEGPLTLLMSFNVFLLLTSYYLIRPTREALILSSPGGAEAKSYLAGGMAILLFFLVGGYAEARLAVRTDAADHGRYGDLHRVPGGVLGSGNGRRALSVGTPSSSGWASSA